MARRGYAGDDPRRKLPDYVTITLSGRPDAELGHILVEFPRGLTHRDTVMLARRFAAHLNAYADHKHELLRRKRRPAAADNGDSVVDSS